jgi:DNA invertase Pin-like site-specific DNA recombinase
MISEMPSVYGYVRFSSARQGEGSSEERQLELINSYSKRNRLHLASKNIYSDLGVSGYHGHNIQEGAALDRFLKDVATGRVPRNSTLLIEALDRLSRLKMLDALELITKIVRAGITIITVVDGKKISAESFDLSTTLLSVVQIDTNHAYAATISRLVRAAWEKKRDAIKRGEKQNHRGPAWLKWSDEDGCFHEIPERVRIVRKIFEMRRKGHPKAAITRYLNKKRISVFGTNKRRAKGWHHSYIERLLKNEAVIGTYRGTASQIRCGQDF